MKETHYLSALQIDSCHIGSFETIAVNTGESEIVEFSFAPVLFCDDVIYLKRSRMICGWQLAVLTTG